MSGTLRFERPQGEAFEASLGAVLAQGGNGRALEARPAGAARGVPDELVVKHGTGASQRLIDHERKSCERIDHPSLVRYYGAATSSEHGTLLAFERLAPNPLLLLNGERLRPRFRDPGTTYYPLPPARAAELAFDLLLGLEHLHARGFVHADVKLANLLVRTPARPNDSKDVLARVADGAFEGVLIDMGSLRSQDELAALAEGKLDPELLPRITPLYAPPEIHFERGELGGRRHYSPAMDSYAFALVFYVLLTGRVPYGHLLRASELQSPDAVLEAKLRESRGELSPVDWRALEAIPLHDVAFEGDPAVEWPDFHCAVGHVFRRCLDPDPRTRLDVPGARAFLEEELRMRPSGVSGARPWSQGLFQMRPRSNRLVGDQPGRAITIREENGQLVALEAVRAVGEETLSARAIDAGAGEGTIAFRRTADKSSGRLSNVPPPPKHCVYLATVLREWKASRPLPVTCPVLVTRTGFSAAELARSLIFSLDAAAAKVRIRDDGRLEEQRRVVIGRVDEADPVVPDKLVSKKHCMIERRHDGWWIEDLGSANGTFMGEAQLEKGKALRLPKPIATVSVGPSSKVTIMEESAFHHFLEQALEAWRQAFGRGQTGRVPRRPPDEPTTPPATKRFQNQDTTPVHLKLPQDHSTETAPLPKGGREDTFKASLSDVKKALAARAAEDAKEKAPTPGGFAPDVVERLKMLYEKHAAIEIVLEGARVETPSELDEALEVLRDEAASILCIDAKLPSGERSLVFQRERKT